MLFLCFHCLCLLFKKWRKGQNRFCLEVRGVGEEAEGRGWGRNDPNNVCTYDYMNKEKKESVKVLIWFQYIPQSFMHWKLSPQGGNVHR
jgi:hypothetical protein